MRLPLKHVIEKHSNSVGKGHNEDCTNFFLVGKGQRVPYEMLV